MKIIRKIEIASPATEVWKVLGDEFVPVHVWMAGVSNSQEITNGQQLQNAPALGRRAEVAVNPGSFLEEVITAYDPKAKSLTIQTTLLNSPKGTPLKGYNTEIEVRPLGDNASEVIWSSNASIHPLGYFLYFAIKKGLSSGFFRGLEELKCFVETGTPHERKLLAKANCG